MSCPKCGGFVIYDTDILSVSSEFEYIYTYHNAYCEDCDWQGYGRLEYKETESYEDDVELPADLITYADEEE